MGQRFPVAGHLGAGHLVLQNILGLAQADLLGVRALKILLKIIGFFHLNHVVPALFRRFLQLLVLLQRVGVKAVVDHNRLAVDVEIILFLGHVLAGGLRQPLKLALGTDHHQHVLGRHIDTVLFVNRVHLHNRRQIGQV